MHRFDIPRVVAMTMLLLAAGCRSDPPSVLLDMPADSIVDGPGAGDPPPARRTGPEAVASKSWAPAAFERPWEYIVIHHSATESGSVEAFDRMHQAKGWDETGYHFVITNGQGGGNGAIEVGGRWSKQKWGSHTGGTPHNEYNNYGIGICLVGDFTQKPPSREQLDSLKRLVTFLMDRYRIPPSRVVGHRDAPNAKTACPGDALERYLNEVLRPELADHGSNP